MWTVLGFLPWSLDFESPAESPLFLTWGNLPLSFGERSNRLEVYTKNKY